MARVFMTGFEAGHKDVFDPAGSVGVSTTVARTGDYALWLNSQSGRSEYTLPANYSEVYLRIGLYPYTKNGDPCTWFALKDSAGDYQLSIMIDAATNSLVARRGSRTGTILGTGSVVTFNAWTCIEFHLTVDNASGVLTVKQDGVETIDFSGDTQATANANVRVLSLGYHGTLFSAWLACYVDDIAINDTTGGVNDSWIGRGGIYGLVPNGAGTHTDFTPSAGANYAVVDEVPPDDDTTYVESSTAAHVDTYAITNLTPTSGAVSAVQWVARAKLAAAGAGNFQRVLRHDGTDYNGGDLAVDVDYAYFTEIFDQAPDSTDWDITKVNALEAGMEVS